MKLYSWLLTTIGLVVTYRAVYNVGYIHGQRSVTETEN